MVSKLSATTTALVLIALTAGGADGASSCSPKLVGETVHYCGPATATLSTFPGVVFQKGSCRRSTVGGKPFMTVKIGVRTQDAAHNSGKDNFELSISGPLSHPTGGGVIAFHKNKRWGGRGGSFKGTAKSGTFVATGINGSRGTAKGKYKCS